MSTDHVAEALDRLPNQFRNDANVLALLRAIVPSMQTLENALQQLLWARAINTAGGAQLDVLGKIVGQKRNGLGDDDYRRYILARIRTNKSSGTVEDLVRIALLVVNSDNARIEVDPQGVAAVVLRVVDVATTFEAASAAITFLRLAVSAGVRLILEYSPAAPENTFRLDTGPGLDVGIMADAMT